MLDSSAQENGEHGRPMASLEEMNLHCLTIFLLSSCGSTEALEFAQTKLAPFGKVQKYVEKLEVRFFRSESLRYSLFITLNLSKYWNFVAGLHGFISLQ